MEKPDLHTAHDTFRELTVYSTARLKADAEARHLAVDLRGAWDGLKAVGENHLAMVDAMVTAMALRDRTDAQVDDFMRTLYRTCQGVHGTKGQRMKELFPGGMTPMIAGINGQPGRMRVFASRLAQDSLESLALSAPLVVDQAGELDEAVDTFDMAVEQVGAAWSQVMRARAEWIRMYEKTYGQLISLVGKRKAEGYFKKLRKPRRKKPDA